MPVRFAHLSDTHLGPERDFRLYDACPARQLDRLVAQLNTLVDVLDFVVHTGDVTSDADSRSASLASEILGQLRLPLYLVGGNHDDVAALRQAFPWPPASAQLFATDRYTYTFCRGGERFLVLDAVGPPEMDPRGQLSSDQLQAVDDCLESCPEPLTVFVHFPALPLDCRWLDEQMLIVNGAELHQRLAAHHARIRGVFFGHVHRGCQAVRDGVFYCSVASTFFQFRNWPADATMLPDPQQAAFYNLVTLTDQQVIVRQMGA